jgi:sulfotransferase family protein
MTQLFLHIGPHKTGSTFIQKVFFDNRERLLGLGVNYPNLGFNGQFGHHEAVEKVRTLEQSQLNEYFVQYLGGEINFISSENFDRLHSHEIKKLQQTLSKVDVKIIYYYRNHVDMLPSWWQEAIKHGSMISFHEFVLPHILRPFTSNIVNPRIVLDLYAKAFGKDNIKIINYSAALQRETIVTPLLELLGIQLPGVKNTSVNASLKLEIVEIIRILNAIADGNGKLKAHNIRTLFLRKKGAEDIRGDVERLVTVIHEQMKPLRLSGSFFENSVIAGFRKEYESCFLNNLLDRSADKELLVPSDTWMLRGECLGVSEQIYAHIMSGDVNF